jgi:uncharacterized protein YfaP (DUF2135 family)
LGILSDVFLGASGAANTKRPAWCSAKIHAAASADQVEEPEAGRMAQAQVSNLVNGVVTRGLAATDATNDRVGAGGTKLHERVQTNTSGRPAYSFPSGSRSIHQRRSNLASLDCFSNERVHQRAVGRLLRN